MIIKQQLKTIFTDILSNYYMHRSRNNEKKKFRDSRRIAIADQYPLSQSQKAQIDDFYIKNYGEKIDYVWHQNYAAHAGHFDYRFFPELLYIPEFEAFQNQNIHAARMLSDKNFLPLLAKGVGVKTPETIVSCTNGVLRDGENRIITPLMAEELIKQCGMCFVKPSVDSGSGQGCLRIEGLDEIHFSNCALNILNINNHKQIVSYDNNYVVQKLIVCNDSIRTLYPGSVNTFRIITYLWKGKIEMMPIIIRIGQGGHYLDNAHQGGVFCAVYENGEMGRYAVTEFNNRYTEHPDTHTIFSSHRIEHVDKVIKAAKCIHSAIPQIGCVNWDFTIDDEDEAVLIEANVLGGGVWVVQMAHGVGPFGERTAEVLQWLKFMKKLKPHERNRFIGGNMNL